MFEKNSSIEKVHGQEGGGKYQDFPSKFFWLTVPENFVGEHLRVSVISGTRFFVEFFASRSTETFPGGTLVCSVLEKFW